jgi:cell shape-determining protein MreC
MSNYHHRQNKNYWGAGALTILVVLLLSIGGSFARDWFAGPLLFVAQPFWQAGDNLGQTLSTQISSLGQSRPTLLIENKNLRDENNKLKIMLLAKNEVEADNLKLRVILGRGQDKIKPLVTRVIFLPNFIPYNSLLLDIGKNNGTRALKIGDLVVADGVVLIGRVAEVDATFSKARLISAETNLPVVIGSKNIPAVATGSGVGNFTITLPKDTPVTLGDRVMAPLLNNYLIGSVGHIEKVASRPTQTIFVKTPVNLFQLKWLEIYDAKT